ncbi:MAG: polyribonucleotide nucleotidyltransferase [candidate division Zixibacteria bacterium]|nr:polyribonucleotide nucleotidyltransferase [Candidatus Tariuqbacter arcticus]
MNHPKEIEIGGRKLSIEFGKVAKQANGAAWVRYGDTIVFSAVVAESKQAPDSDFFPLTVDYREKTYAAGRIPGGFFKREGRPNEKEILSARLIDRPIRPLFPDWYKCETLIMVSILSADGENDGALLGAIASSAALAVSDIPFLKPIAEVAVGRIDGEFVVNPTFAQVEQSDMKIVVAGTSDSIVMVEGECSEIPESIIVGAINFAHEQIKNIIAFIEESASETAKPKIPQPELEDLTELENIIVEIAEERVKQICDIGDKAERETAMGDLEDELLEKFAEDYPDNLADIKMFLHDLEKRRMRSDILNENRRLDGRGEEDIRNITGEVSLLPRAHGSALFTRGQTQALAATTLGSRINEQRIDSLEGDFFKRFIMHYNFPGYATGEINKRFGVSRREVGHGNLAERALKPILPSYEECPYTIRIVSEILESNGSSSMATVCAGCLSLMDAGIPIKKPVAGVAMGLVMEDDKYVILTDILGAEDHLGDMDFKIAGTRDGVTAIQMDIKIDGISADLMEEALERAKKARLSILDSMVGILAEPREKMSPYAPNILFMKVAIDKIGLVIGPSGKHIREITEKTGSQINIEDDGTIQIVSEEQRGANEARDMIIALTAEPEVGKIYEGPIVKITDFGAFVEIMPGKEGLLHISNIAHHRVNKVTDILKVGEIVKVKLLDLDSQGKMDLSRKALLERPEGATDTPYQRDSRPGDRNKRPGGRGGGHRSGGDSRGRR